MKNLLYLISVLLLLNCKKVEKFNEYEKFSSEIPFELINYLPKSYIKKIEENDLMIIAYPTAIKSVKYSGIILGYNFSRKDYNKELQIISKHYKKIIKNDKSCINYVPGVLFKDSLCEPIILPNVKDSLFIPSGFLSSEINYFIKNKSKGNFLKEKFPEYYEANPNRYHGYSSGAIVDKKNKTIIYWFLII